MNLNWESIKVPEPFSIRPDRRVIVVPTPDHRTDLNYQILQCQRISATYYIPQSLFYPFHGTFRCPNMGEYLLELERSSKVRSQCESLMTVSISRFFLDKGM